MREGERTRGERSERGREETVRKGRERERASVGGFGFAQRPWLLSSSSSSSLLHTFTLLRSLSLLFNLVFIYLPNFLFPVFTSLNKKKKSNEILNLIKPNKAAKAGYKS